MLQPVLVYLYIVYLDILLSRYCNLVKDLGMETEVVYNICKFEICTLSNHEKSHSIQTHAKKSHSTYPRFRCGK